MISLEVQWVRLYPTAELPSRAHTDDAGFDLVCVKSRTLEPGETRDISTGLAIAMPPGWWARIVGRSSTMRKRGLPVIEGVIDAGFRGELFTCVHNPGERAVMIKRGERLAQLMSMQVPGVHWREVQVLPESSRGVKGFGSSGA